MKVDSKKIYKCNQRKNSKYSLKLSNSSGITLIVLAITIIVLLVLAGVSIAMLTGTNGILTQAQKAKETNDNSATEEKVKLIATTTKMQAETGTLDADKLVKEITTSYGGRATKSENEFPITAEIDGKKFEVDSDGNIAVNKNIKEITGNEETNIITQDNLGNKIVVPAGLEVVNPNDNVTDGIVIKDKTHANTAGSEFVWIPVGDIETTDRGTVNIELNRYTFDSEGNETKQGSNEIISSHSYTEDTLNNHNSECKNTIAKDIEDFKTKTQNSHGYYIGRYEARTTAQRTSKVEELTPITLKPNDYVYNWVTQPEAATLSREMYTETSFESDLINSYAWDTATLFLQTFGNNSKKYSLQNSSNLTFASQGTNNQDNKDLICNVYDMASNCFEWNTETYRYNSSPCTNRGGYYSYSNGYTNSRGNLHSTYSDILSSFRPILYL